MYSGDELLKHWLDRDARVDTKALLNSRDLQRLAVSNLEKTATTPAHFTPLERPVVTRISPQRITTNNECSAEGFRVKAAHSWQKLIRSPISFS